MTDTDFLPGVPAAAVLAALARAPGNEAARISSPDSSAALAVNAFGWFLDRPSLLPPLPGVPMGKVDGVEVEAELKLPWRGGRHPWLHAVLTTSTTLVGVEARRFEPFRPGKASAFTEPFDSREWGEGMNRFAALREALSGGRKHFASLDAVQLVKTAYALKTQGIKRARGAVLVYLHAAPANWANGKPVDPAAIARHESEISDFARAVKGDDVTFVALRWRDLLAEWAGKPALAAHAAALTARFGPL